jgi:acrylyl-CoA reductase (NADPH)/3-hydroxypropionyl-CoA dehydratase/3-hydroxypropionyl-CoA synthetase
VQDSDADLAMREQYLLTRPLAASSSSGALPVQQQQQQQQQVTELSVCPWLVALWRLISPLPVEASFPLFVLYTSGSTGKPKGIVHTHGGYQVGLLATSKAVFGLGPPTPAGSSSSSSSGSNSSSSSSSSSSSGSGSNSSSSSRSSGSGSGGSACRAAHPLLVIATPGWITGRSYMLACAMLCREPSVLLDGSPVAPPDRFARVMATRRVAILNAGSTFLRMVMTGGEPAPCCMSAALWPRPQRPRTRQLP